MATAQGLPLHRLVTGAAGQRRHRSPRRKEHHPNAPKAVVTEHRLAMLTEMTCGNGNDNVRGQDTPAGLGRQADDPVDDGRPEDGLEQGLRRLQDQRRQREAVARVEQVVPLHVRSRASARLDHMLCGTKSSSMGMCTSRCICDAHELHHRLALLYSPARAPWYAVQNAGQSRGPSMQAAPHRPLTCL